MIKKILAIDFDGVIHDYKHPLKGRRMGEPIPGTKEALLKLRNQGNKIIIHTVWDKHDAIKAFMEYYDLPYHEITNIKPNADFYIDDHAIKFTKWDDIL